MGTYLNPGNNAFRRILKGGTYVDKTGLIEFVNSTVNTTDCMTCFSRPRRFGKSYAAKMLCAYYSRGCDSHELFKDLEISQADSYEEYMNKCNVVYIDVTRITSMVTDVKKVVSYIQSEVISEIHAAYPDCVSEDETMLADALMDVTEKTGTQFFFIIDEWDALFREAKNDDAVQWEYVQLLRGLFKGGVATDETIAGAYITGILPIKKYGTHSAMTDFREFTMVKPYKLSKYVGFTENEVKDLCQQYDLDYQTMREWYDGYSFSRVKHVYNPNSVMLAISNEDFSSYWTSSETYDALKQYIGMNFDGLKDAVISLLGGLRVNVDPLGFQNDMTSIRNKDDVLTLLVHLGYLAYDEDEWEVYIPNLEVADSFKLAVQDSSWEQVGEAVMQSDKLLSATINMDGDAVADALELVHESSSSVLQYNNENSLSCAVTIAYYTARRFYNIVRELPAGKGFADLAFIPKKNCSKPAMVVELKYNQSADGAITQIKERRYTGALSDYDGEILLVGINYDKETKKHGCVIEWA